MEKYVNVEPLPPAVLFEEPLTADGIQKTNEFGAIEDDEDEDEEEEEEEEEGEGDDDEEGQLSLQPLGKSESVDREGGSVTNAATSILGTVLSSSKSPFELLEDDED
jgi:hypothetical protein